VVLLERLDRRGGLVVGFAGDQAVVGTDPGQVELDRGTFRNRNAAIGIAARLRGGALFLGLGGDRMALGVVGAWVAG
jgi:hypothetical protein